MRGFILRYLGSSGHGLIDIENPTGWSRDLSGEALWTSYTPHGMHSKAYVCSVHVDRGQGIHNSIASLFN